MKCRNFQSIVLSTIVILTALMLLQSCGDGTEKKASDSVKETVITKPKASDIAWRNTVDSIPQDWSGPLFELSDDYPENLPKGDLNEMFPWLALDVEFNSPTAAWNNNWEQYIELIKDYIVKGQDPNLDNQQGFRTLVDGATRWFHIPWMAYDPTTGREFTHGTTNERTAHISDFLGDNTKLGLNTIAGGVKADAGFETWAVGCYNDFGGYAIGQAWNKDGTPNYTTENGLPAISGLPFPEGTVVMKVLFTTATPEDVPYLKGSAKWEVNRHVQINDSTFSCQRKPAPVYLVQMDIATVDHRSPTNWVFGTFAYNGTLDGETVWDRMSPVGLQWGMDGESWPAVPKAESKPIHESVLAPINIYEHNGCNQRLAGPVDNKLASCMSCHGGAFAPENGQVGKMGENIPPIFGFPTLCKETDGDNKAYFTTYKWPDKYPNGKYNTSINLDFSLQMWVGFLQFGNWNVLGHPDSCNLN